MIYAQTAPGQGAMEKMSRRKKLYHRPRPLSRPRPMIPAKPPARRPSSCHAAGVGLLVTLLALQNGTMAPRQQGDAWRHVADWATEIVETRQKQEAARCERLA